MWFDKLTTNGTKARTRSLRIGKLIQVGQP